MPAMLIPATEGHYHIIALADGTLHRIPIIAWRIQIGEGEALGPVDYLTADHNRTEKVVAVQYPTGAVEEVGGKIHSSFVAFAAHHRGTRSSMTRSEAISFLMLVKNETTGRDYGPGLTRVIELLNEL